MLIRTSQTRPQLLHNIRSIRRIPSALASSLYPSVRPHHTPIACTPKSNLHARSHTAKPPPATSKTTNATYRIAWHQPANAHWSNITNVCLYTHTYSRRRRRRHNVARSCQFIVYWTRNPSQQWTVHTRVRIPGRPNNSNSAAINASPKTNTPLSSHASAHARACTSIIYLPVHFGGGDHIRTY